MLIMKYKMTSLHVKVYGFMIRRLVGKTELVNSFMVSHKLTLLTCLVPKVMNLFASWSLYLIFPERRENQICIETKPVKLDLAFITTYSTKEPTTLFPHINQSTIVISMASFVTKVLGAPSATVRCILVRALKD